MKTHDETIKLLNRAVEMRGVWWTSAEEYGA